MNAKVRILDDGRGVYLELDGKTIGEGVDLIEYKKKGSDPAELTIHIYNTCDFQFHPDGTFDKAEKWLNEHEGYRKPLPLAPWDQSESS